MVLHSPRKRAPERAWGFESLALRLLMKLPPGSHELGGSFLLHAPQGGFLESAWMAARLPPKVSQERQEGAGCGSIVPTLVPTPPPCLNQASLPGDPGATNNGARGIRTPKPFRALAFEASAIPFCQRSKTVSPRQSSVRIRRSVDPQKLKQPRNADRYIKSGRPDLNRGPLRPERSALPD
jgi:hypothetical protein